MEMWAFDGIRDRGSNTSDLVDVLWSKSLAINEIINLLVQQGDIWLDYPLAILFSYFIRVNGE